jgi:DNA-3-methyladenine glycosylase II
VRAVPVLRIPEPYDFELSTRRFRAFGTDLANLWHDGALYRAVGGREVRIEPARCGVDVEPLDADTSPVVERLLGLPFDLDAFAAFAVGEPVLASLVDRFRGLRPPLAPDPFEALVTSITAQQISLFAAFAIRNRLIERYGERAGLAYSFPARDRLAEAREEDLVALGFSRRKAEYVVSLARSDIDLDALAALPDDEIRARIVAQRGLGAWTAEWFLARHLARPRAWPAGDLALRQAVARFYGKADVRAVGERLDPFQNLAAHYLLAGLLAARE